VAVHEHCEGGEASDEEDPGGYDVVSQCSRDRLGRGKGCREKNISRPARPAEALIISRYPWVATSRFVKPISRFL
jgi:hypothetical protein